MKLNKIFFWTVVTAIGVTAASCTAWHFLSYKLSPDGPSYKGGEIELKGLDNEVSVIFDEHLIPHVTAKSIEDLSFATGYLHARERLFQMDLLRHLACGRIAEMFGNRPTSSLLEMADTITFDKWFRAMGLCRAAKKAPDIMSPESRKLLEAYTSGVNAYIKTGKTPLEYRLAGLELEPWQASDTIAIARLNGYFLSGNLFMEMIRYIMRQELGVETQEETIPVIDLWGPAIIEPADRNYREESADRNSDVKASSDENFEKDRALGEAWGNTAKEILSLSTRIQKEVSPYVMQNASNNWAIASSKSKSGKPILANDPHLNHTAPSVMYLMHLNAPGIDVVGATIPGVPFVILGHNRHIAWSLTTTFADVQDVYLEKADPADPARYLYKGASEPFKIEKETILERMPSGGFKKHPVTFRFTRHGVILNDAISGIMPISNGGLLALKTTLEEKSDELDAMLNLSRSNTVIEARKALFTWGTPIQNWVMADDSGHILYFPAGLVPIRKGWDGTYPVPGWTGEYEWEKFIPFDELPQMLDPPSGIIITSNNRVVPIHDYPYPFSIDAIPGYRAARIKEMLGSKEKWSAGEIQKLQTDVYSKQAERLMPALVSALSKARLEEPAKSAFNELVKWDRRATTDSVGTTIFFSTYRTALQETLRDDISKQLFDFTLSFGFLASFFDRLWAEVPDAKVFDAKETTIIEGRDDILLMSFRKATSNLASKLSPNVSEWQWGKVCNIEFQHPFGEEKKVRSAFNFGPFPHPGAMETVWMSEGHWDGCCSFKVFWGPAFRHVIDMNSVDDAGMILDLGQSGWPLTKGYSNAFEYWHEGKLWRISMDAKKYSDDKKGTYTLVPDR